MRRSLAWRVAYSAQNGHHSCFIGWLDSVQSQALAFAPCRAITLSDRKKSRSIQFTEIIPVAGMSF